MSTSTEAVVIGRRFQKVSSFHFNHPVKCVSPQGTEAVAVHHTEGFEHVTSVYTLTAHSHCQRRASTEKTVQWFLYIKKCRVYIMFCADLTLRVYSETFHHLQTTPTTSTALSMEFVEANSTLYIGESGFVKSWHLSHQLYSPLEPESHQTVPVGKDKWVVGLEYETDTGILAAVTEEKVILIDTNLNQEIATYSSKCRVGVTGAVLFSSLGYLVLAFRDGSLEVLSTVLKTSVGQLSGHLRAVTALKRHVTGSGLISSSLDGTVRVWSLDTLSECNRLDLGVEVLGLTVCSGGGDTAQLVCHSHYDISIWRLSQLETHFASIYSTTVALRQEVAPDVSRILATTEDDSVRLLCPKTGETITTFFPIFSADVLREVVYCPLGRLLFALLAAGKLLVLSAHTNPCSTLQLWTSAHRETIETLSTCVMEWQGRPHSLVFGGSACGHILLLHSSTFAMERPCPAHGGRVCRLVSSASPVALTGPSTSPTPSLLSLGSDNFLNGWRIVVNERGDRAELKLLICVQMESLPVQVCLLGTLVCVAGLSNSVEMVELSPELMKGHPLPHGRLFQSLPVLSHQREDRHLDTITSLSCCPELSLFTTTSLDGLLKVWNTSNQLVAEIDFSERLLSACFSGSLGDLLVGFQGQLCSVSASQYLPPPYLSLGHAPTSPTEEPIPFDPSLQFWYDPQRVPSYPVQLEERKKQCRQLEHYYTSANETLQQRRKKSSGEMTEKRELSASVDGALRAELSGREDLHLHASVVDAASCKLQEKSSLSLLRDAIASGLGAMRSQELARALVDQTPKSQRRAPIGKFPAEVSPLETPFSPSLPIAPDCLVPNSTLRQTIGYVPAPDPLALLQQSAIDRILATSPPAAPHSQREQKTHKDKNGILTRDGSSEDGESVSENDGIPSDSGELDDPLGERAEISESGVKLDMAPSTSGSVADLSDDSGRDEDSSSVLVVVGSAPLPREVKTESSPHQEGDRGPPERELSEMKVNSSTTPASTDVPGNQESDNPITTTTAVETKVVPTVTIPFQVGPLKTTVAPPPGATGGRGGGVARAGGGGGVARAGGGGPGREGAACEEGVLQRVMRMARFPSDLCRSITTTQGVCDEIVSMLRCVDADSIRDVCSAIAQLSQGSEVTEGQRSTLARALVARLSPGSPSLSAQAVLQALEALRTTADDSTLLLAILPFLTHSNMEVCRSAFGALRAVADISTRSELHQRLVDMGILQHIDADEDEVLRALSGRLERERVKSVASARVLVSLPAPAPGTRERGCPVGHHGRNDDDGAGVKGNRGREWREDGGREGEKRNGAEEESERLPLIQRVSTASRRASSRRRKSCSLISRAGTTMIRARLTHQPVLPSTNTAGEPRRSNQTGASRLPPRGSGVGREESRNLQRLLATRPTLFSQSAPIREIMRGAYSTPAGKGERKERDFKWTEVFPVLRRGCVERSCCCASKTDSGHRCREVELKLPKIV